MQNVTTQSVSIEAGYEKVFAYIANPLTQPEWAVNFMKAVTETPEGYKAVTPFGEVALKFRSDKGTGTIDIILGEGSPIPTRVIPNGDGCEYLFTLFQPNAMPDEAWEKEGIPGLQAELRVLKAILERP